VGGGGGDNKVCELHVVGAVRRDVAGGVTQHLHIQHLGGGQEGAGEGAHLVSLWL
jgi:hypothetical protein